jgi:hypothetical protein
MQIRAMDKVCDLIGLLKLGKKICEMTSRIQIVMHDGCRSIRAMGSRSRCSSTSGMSYR